MANVQHLEHTSGSWGKVTRERPLHSPGCWVPTLVLSAAGFSGPALGGLAGGGGGHGHRLVHSGMI